MKQLTLSRTVRISNELYEDISKCGKFGDTFDSVLKRIIKEKSQRVESKSVLFPAETGDI